MVKHLFPFKVLIFEIKSFDNIVYYFYRYIWTLQIFSAFIYCILIKRFLPVFYFSKKRDYHFMLKQLNFYFIGVIVIYIAEIYYTDIFWTEFERFVHHVFAILLFSSTVYEPNVISFIYLLPTLVHAIYWAFLRSGSDYIYGILMIYNTLIFLMASLMFYSCHWKSKRISIRCPLFVTFVFHSNMMGHFYGYGINFSFLHKEKFVDSLARSTCLALPVYLYLILTFYKIRKEKKQKVKTLQIFSV